MIYNDKIKDKLKNFEKVNKILGEYIQIGLVE